jgi:uncharacterized protein YcfJ
MRAALASGTEECAMQKFATGVASGVLVALTATGALAQTAYDDATCRQYADQNTAALRAQAQDQAVGGTVVGTLLGAGIGAAIGGGRGAAIGAGTGAIVGTGTGAANAQQTADYANQQYYAYYQQCMASRAPAAPPPSYAPAPASTQQLNQQQLQQGPGYAPYPQR